MNRGAPFAELEDMAWNHTNKIRSNRHPEDGYADDSLGIHRKTDSGRQASLRFEHIDSLGR